MVVGSVSSESVAVINQGEYAEVIFTFDQPIPYKQGMRGEGYIIDTKGRTYPISFLVIENVKNVNC
ncbi:hypothetical protein [Pyrobaculum aerophilum]|uniref:Uncharacterized protein n=1 Tax=Pyrobaculum aerophilum TaxID=13773 RepID=A0A371R162_9CREN|nr:hypothetical protein [Pyrobaculum aerophilum]RFA97154.1 hypothetical protein CGL51_03730 [Pyrobaculum aerophilum]RFB00053.1 hypothetical protein CGL52_02550 [Pyrobaculum aerophilum]